MFTIIQLHQEVLWNYRDKINNVDINGNASDGKSFEYKAKQQKKHQKYHHNLKIQETQTNQHNHLYHP